MSKKQDREAKKREEARRRRRYVSQKEQERHTLLHQVVGESRPMTGDLNLFTSAQKTLSAAGVSMDAPGFYDSPEFLAQEKKDKRFLEQYGLFVRNQEYSDEYLARARRAVPTMARIVYEALKEDGRLGACIDASNTLSRLLDRIGIWNYVETGGLVIDVPNAVLGHYFPIRHPDNPAKTGHTWVVAPPYRVVDVTLTLQPNISGKLSDYPDFVVAEKYWGAPYTIAELTEPEAVFGFLQHHGRKPTTRDLIHPAMVEVERHFGTCIIVHNQSRFKYIPTAISASDVSLERITSFCATYPNPAVLLDRYRALAAAEATH